MLIPEAALFKASHDDMNNAKMIIGKNSFKFISILFNFKGYMESHNFNLSGGYIFLKIYAYFIGLILQTLHGNNYAKIVNNIHANITPKFISSTCCPDFRYSTYA
jgi:hypothetical protein